MAELTTEIKRLEQAVEQHRTAAREYYQQSKTLFNNKVSTFTSPALLITAFIAGGLMTKKSRDKIKSRSSKSSHTQERWSYLQKMLALSSEISIAIKLYNHIKPMLKIVQKKK